MLQAIIEYFGSIPAPHRTLIIAAGLCFFWVLEGIRPFFHFTYHKWKHAISNLFFTLTTIVVNFSMAFILVKSSQWVSTNQWGILHLFPMPLWLFLLLGILLMDLIGAYAIHYTQHKVKWMWRFHMVHHTDQFLDTTSGNRHHPGESVFRFVFTTLAVVLIGAPMWMVFLYQTMSVVLTQFNHANVKFPRWLESVLVFFICTPTMHRVHHHYRMPYTDSNYGNIFSFWDRIFGTFKKANHEKIIFGLDTHMRKEESDHIGTLLKIPFMPYRTSINYPQEEKLS